jgi:hypothetical protein
MNWLIYIGGYAVGLGILIRSAQYDETDTLQGMTLVISWTMLWVGICWRFIK